jgi:hypothetical protein
VVVVAGDGQVPHPPVVNSRDRAAPDDRRLAVWCLEMHARFEVFGRNPALVQVRIPEEMAAGGADELHAASCLDLQVIQVRVMVHLDCRHGL